MDHLVAGQFSWIERNKPPYRLPEEMKLHPEEMTAIGRRIGGVSLRSNVPSESRATVEPEIIQDASE